MYELLADTGEFFVSTWWFWAFLILFSLFYSTWMSWRQEQFRAKTKYTLLELKIPREVKEHPKAMQQVLEAMHSLRNVASDIREIYWDGEVSRTFSFEIVAFENEIHFYIRVPITWAEEHDPLRELVEVAFFSYYPNVEVEEVEDYAKNLPQTMEELYGKGNEMWGTEFILSKPAMYPVKTYDEFEALDKEEPYDNMSTYLELLAKGKKGQFTAFQIILAFMGDEWTNPYRGEISKLKKKAEGIDEVPTKKASSTVGFPGGILPSYEIEGSESRPEKVRPTKREEEVLKLVEENLSESAFKTLIRMVHISPRESYYEAYPRRGVSGAFNQYNTTDMNSIEKNHNTSSRTRLWLPPYIFPRLRGYLRNQRLLYTFIERKYAPDYFMGRVITSHLFGWNFSSKRFPMGLKCIATLFHPPMSRVLTVPRIRRIESKRAAPQINLPIFGDEEELEKFK